SRVANGEISVSTNPEKETTTPTPASPVNGTKPSVSVHIAKVVAPVAPPTLTRTFRIIEMFDDAERLNDWFGEAWKDWQEELSVEEKEAFHGAYLAKLLQLEGAQS